MRHMAALLVLLLACGAPLAAGRLLLAEPPAPGVLRVGFGSESRAPMSSLEDGQPRGELAEQAAGGHRACAFSRRGAAPATTHAWAAG